MENKNIYDIQEDVFIPFFDYLDQLQDIQIIQNDYITWSNLRESLYQAHLNKKWDLDLKKKDDILKQRDIKSCRDMFTYFNNIDKPATYSEMFDHLDNLLN
ncbi:MAG: hypothetical protein K0B02_01815 [DPANN group archaeon]|nr:hypothetical protein [DPANN group archaeon]